MTLHVEIPPDVEARLRSRAGEAGQSLDDYASTILVSAVTSPTLDELLEPVRRDFAATGMSEEEIIELGRRELEAMRAEDTQGK